MMNIKSVLSIARAETRVTRRLVRYWLFLAFSALIIFLAFIYYSVLHGLFSSYSATVGLVCPRFLASSVAGTLYQAVYSIGVVFLAFDIRARDKRERMYEVLDTRPYTNLELVAGRFLGILIPVWVPILIISFLLELLGVLLKSSGLPIGEPIEIRSLLNFVFFMSLPALAYMISVVFLVTLLLRNRLAAAVILLIFIGVSYWGIYFLPVYKAQLIDFLGVGQANFPSDLILSVIKSGGLLQRAGILLASIGILGICAAVHPRLDDGSRTRTALSGIIIVLIAAAAVGTVYLRDVKILENKEMWLKAQKEYSQLPVPDLKKVTGRVDIDPGKLLDLDITISFSAPESESIKNAVFTLNPGQKVTEILDSSGKPLSYTHETGLLIITLPSPLMPGEEASVKLKITGIPDKNFAYLKSVVDARKLETRNGNIALLGSENAIYDSSFVALMPALRWLPASGTENSRDNHLVRPADYFNVDLNVRLPKGWLVAGPGRRNKSGEEQGHNVFRFSPPSVVPEVTLIASEFESRSFETENVLMELLIHKKHAKNIEVLADTGEKIREYIESRMKEAKENELSYPYDGLTLVEVPGVLRTFGGGWRLDTVQSHPGVMFLKELSLPTARFDSAFRNPQRFKNVEGGIVQAKWERLQNYFKNDLSGGNVFTGVSKNFFLFQTSASGPEDLAINFVTDALTGLVITDTKSYFSAHIFVDPTGINQVANNVLRDYFQRRGIGETILNATINSRTSRPVIWEKTLETSLKDMDPWKDPEDMVDVLALKGYAVADSIFDTLGREKTAALLASIRKDYRGKTFTAVDMLNASKEIGYDMKEQLGDWTGSTGLPGFVVPEARGYRIADDENGAPRYQLLFTVRNDEPVPGVFNFIYYYQGEDQKAELTPADPIHLAGRHAIQYGTIVSRPPTMCFLHPYLSLNRSTFELKMNTIDPQKIVREDLIEGVHEIPWEIPVSASIIVDDLDKTFSTSTVGLENEGLRLKAKKQIDRDTDQGLPYISATILPGGARLPREWSRISSGVDWGKYRHTAAIIRAGEGNKKARFKTNLPKDGAWDLEFYIPVKSVFQGKEWGTWHVVVTDSNGDNHNVEFDSKAGIAGWNLAGKLALPEGEVTVELSDLTDGDLVVADAIRVTPAAGN
jgi:hypothetical protein